MRRRAPDAICTSSSPLSRGFIPRGPFQQGPSKVLCTATYNAGPGNIVLMRREALKRGLDNNLWFNSVEVVTADKLGMETPTYVRNIYKYYVSYKLMLEVQEAEKKARETVRPGK